MDKQNSGVFLGRWENVLDLEADFQDGSVLDYNIIVACYDGGEYDGECAVLCEKDGQLFETSSGHCSCNGLEGTFEPQPVTQEYLKMRFEMPSPFPSDIENEYRAAVKRWLENQQ